MWHNLSDHDGDFVELDKVLETPKPKLFPSVMMTKMTKIKHEKRKKKKKKDKLHSSSAPPPPPDDTGIDMARLLEPEYLGNLMKRNIVSINKTSSSKALHSSLELYAENAPETVLSIGKTSKMIEAERRAALAELPQRLCKQIVQLDSSSTDDTNTNLSLGQTALQDVLGKLQKLRSVIVRKRQLAKVGDVRWTSVKQQLQKRAQNERKKNISKRPIETRIAVEMALQMLKAAEKSGPELVAVALQTAMIPLKKIMAELPDLLKKDKAYHKTSTGLFDEIEDFLCRVFQGEIVVPAPTRDTILSSVGSMLIQLGVSRQSAKVLVRLCHTILCHPDDEGTLAKLPLDTLGIQALMEVSQPPQNAREDVNPSEALDQFGLHGSTITLSNDKRTVTSISGGSSVMAAGRKVVSTGTYTWRLKVEPPSSGGDGTWGVTIGVAPAIVRNSLGSLKNNIDCHAMALSISGSGLKPEFIDVQLNITSGTVSFLQNGIPEGKARKLRGDRSQGYCLFIRFNARNIRISIEKAGSGHQRGSLKVWGKLEAKTSVNRRGHVVHPTGGMRSFKTMCKSMYKHGLALDKDNSVYGWGDASQGALGPKLHKNIGFPQRLNLDFQGRVTAIGCGSAFSAAVTSDGKLFMWGNVNMMKDEKYSPPSTVREIQLPKGLKAFGVACGFNFTLITLGETKKIQTLYSFGKNNRGQLGIGSVEEKSEPQVVDFSDSAKASPNIVSLACGWYHALAADSKGHLYSWGGAVSGNKPVCGLGYGDGKDTPQLTPQRVKSMSESRVISVVCGHDHSMCVDSAGRAWSWGSNEFGQLGNSEVGVDRPSPTLLTPAYLPTVKHLAGGKAHSAAITTEGALYCWGQLDKSWATDSFEGPQKVDSKDESNAVGVISTPHLICANRCFEAACFMSGHVLALCETASLRQSSSAKGDNLVLDWQETGLEPFRPDPCLKNSSNFVFREEGDSKGSIRVICNDTYPDRCIAFNPVLSKGCFEVEFKIIRAQNIQMDIGVLPADHRPSNWRSEYLYKSGYTLSSWGTVYARNVETYSSPWNTYSAVYRPNDTVRLKLDMDQRKMWVAVNNGEMLKCLDDLPSRVMVGLGIYNIKCEVVVTPLSSGHGSNVRLLEGSSLYSRLWIPPAIREITTRAEGNIEAAGDAVVALMRAIAELCGQQSYPSQEPSILGAPALLSAPLCIDGKGPEMIVQLVEIADVASRWLRETPQKGQAPPEPLNSPEIAPFLLLATLRIIRANLHRILLSGVDQRWLQLTEGSKDPVLHPWMSMERKAEGKAEGKEGKTEGRKEEDHFLRKLHLILFSLILGEYELQSGAKKFLTDEASHIVALAIELLYPTTGERLKMVNFLLDSDAEKNPLAEALKGPVLEAFCRDRLCTLLIPEPIKIPRRLRMSMPESERMAPEEEKAVEQDKRRFKNEVETLRSLLLRVSNVSVQQGRRLIEKLHGDAKEGKSKVLSPGIYQVKPGVSLSIQKTLELDSVEVAKLKPLARFRVEEVLPWKGTNIIRGRISAPSHGWVSLFDLERTAFWIECLPTKEMELLYALHRHTLTWASAYTKVVKNVDKMDLPEGEPDIDINVSLETGEVVLVRMNKKDRITSLKEKVTSCLPNGPPGFSADVLLDGAKLNDEDTLEGAGVQHKTKVHLKKSRTPALRRTLSAFQPRSKEQAKASLFAAEAVEEALKAYSVAILRGSYELCADIQVLSENQQKAGKKYSMETYRAMDVLKKILGAVGGPLVLTALSSSSSVEALPNTLKLSQDSVERLMSAISPIVPIAIPVLPTVDTKTKKSLGEDALVVFDQTVLAPHVTLSNGGLTVEKSSGSNQRWNTVRLNKWMPRNSGRYSYEFVIDAAPSKWIFIGCASETFNKWQDTSNSFLGCIAGSWGFSMGGGPGNATRLYGAQRAPSAFSYSDVKYKFSTGDRVTLHVDTDLHTIAFEKNGEPLGVAFQGIQYQKLIAGVTVYNINDRVSFVPKDGQLHSQGPPVSSASWRISARSLPNDGHALWDLARIELYSDQSSSTLIGSYEVKSKQTAGAKSVSADVEKTAKGTFLRGHYTFEFKEPVSIKTITLTNSANVRAVKHFDLEFRDETGKWRLAQSFSKSRYSARWARLTEKVTAVDFFAPDYWQKKGSTLRCVPAGSSKSEKSPYRKFKGITGTNSKHKWATALGAHSFSSGYREWVIKVEKFAAIEAMLGVAKTNFSKLDRDMSDRGCYAYVATARRTDPKLGEATYGQLWKEGDIITVCLDLNSRTLSFKINGKKLGVSHKNLPKGSYRLACSVGNSSTILTIQDIKRPDPVKPTGDSKSSAAGPKSPVDEELTLPWASAPWLGQLQALLGTSLCEVLCQKLTHVPVDGKARLDSLKRLHQMLRDFSKVREDDQKAVWGGWLAQLSDADNKTLNHLLADRKSRSAVENLGKDKLSECSASLKAKILALRKMGSMSSAMQRGLLHCLLVSLEGGLLSGLSRPDAENIGKELMAMIQCVTKILANGALGSSERLYALKIIASLMAKRFLGLSELREGGVFKILKKELKSSSLPAASLEVKNSSLNSSSFPLSGTFSELRERITFEATIFEVFRMWVAMSAQDGSAAERKEIVSFVLSELTRLSPKVVAEGKEKLRLQEKKLVKLTQGAKQPSDQSKYAEELTQLQYMGFVDVEKNLRALKAANGNLNDAVEKILGGGPIAVPAATSARAPRAILPASLQNASEAGESSSDSPSLSIWVDTSKIQALSSREVLLAYRGTEKGAYQYQPHNNQHRWLPRLTLSVGQGRFSVSALVSVGSATTNYISQLRVGSSQEYEMDGGMVHMAFLVDSKQVSLYVNGKLDATKPLSQQVWSPPHQLQLVWGLNVAGYEAPWYAVRKNPSKVMWLQGSGASDFSDHYASVLLGLFNWLPAGELVSESDTKRPERPKSLHELLKGAGLLSYEEAFDNAGYDDFDFVMSLSEAERQDFYATVMMAKADQERYEGYLKALNPPPSTLASFIGMLLAGTPKVQLAVIRLLRRVLPFVAPEAFDEVMETESSEAPPGTRMISVLGTTISNVLWAPYDNTIISHPQLSAHVSVAIEAIHLLRQLVLGASNESSAEKKSKHLPPIERWSHTVKQYMEAGMKELKTLVHKLRPLTAEGGEWDDAVINAIETRKALEALYIACGATVCGVASLSLQSTVSDYHYYYYAFSPYGETIKKQLKDGNLKVRGSSSTGKPDDWSLGNEVARMLENAQQQLAMYGTLDSDGKPPYSALEFNLVRLWSITGIAPRAVNRMNKYKKAYDQFKMHEAKKSSSGKLSGLKSQYWASGTGYGHGSNPQESARLRKMKKEHEERERKRNAEVLSIMGSVLVQLNSSKLENSFVSALGESSVIPWLISLLRQTSTLDIQKNIEKYNIALDVIEAMAKRSELTFLFLPSESDGVENGKPTLKDVLQDQKTSAEMMLKLAGEKTSEKMRDLFKKIVSLHKLAASAIKKHQKQLKEAKSADDGSKDAKQNALGHKKLIAGNAHNSKVYGWVDEKQYVSFLRPRLFAEISEFKSHHYRKVTSKSKSVGALWTNRLAAEFVGLSKSLPLNPNSSVFFRCCSKDMAYAKMIIAAPPSTPYGYGLFLFDVYFPPQYPNVPPKVNLMTTGRASVRFNPNLYNCGKVCLSLLGTWSGSPEEMWQPKQSTFLQVCVSIQSLIFIEHPYFNEPGYESSMNTSHGMQKSRQYNSSREVATVQWAMLDMLKNPPPGFEHVVKTHFYLQQKNICLQIEKWLKRPEHKSGQLQTYYNQLKEEFKNLKEPSLPQEEDEDEDEESDDDDF